ncbi:hypothetical protein [Halocynthiibacter namhaensis]|uniref:hypothetical protein n=1 Tax=Halocynthiibacter namhaensis TaxID=1290553 RepID=UPI0005798499|nr:hypothetical protein [Halocynthiibacter namhaensis]
MSKSIRPKGSEKKTTKCKKRDKVKAAPCKSINQPPNSPIQVPTEQVKGLGRILLGKSHTLPDTKNDEGTGYDANAADSKKMHARSCKKYKKKIAYKILRRRLASSTDLCDINALLGLDGYFSGSMPSCDLKLRKETGNYLIDELQELREKLKADHKLKAYFITFVEDRSMFNERGGTAEVFKHRQAVQAAIGNYTSFNAIGVIENQAIINYPRYQKGKMLSVHSHVICWGPKNDVPKLKKRAKRFKSSILQLTHRLKAIRNKKITNEGFG